MFFNPLSSDVIWSWWDWIGRYSCCCCCCCYCWCGSCWAWVVTIICVHVSTKIATITLSSTWVATYGIVPWPLNLALCCSIMLTCLASLTLFMKVWHSLKVSLSKTLDYWFIHVSLFVLLRLMVLVMHLTLSLSNCLSVFLIISMLLVVLMVFLSFTLTGVTTAAKHLNVNLL